MPDKQNVSKKRGRRTKEEYYQTKQIDNVLLENDYSIFLPISLDECLHNPNIDMTLQIMSSTPVISGYSPEKSNLEYSEINKEIKNSIEPISENPIYKEEIHTEKHTLEKEYYDMTLISNEKTNMTYDKSSICCWWCCHTFNTKPVHLPVSFKKDSFKVIGIFCSFSCCYSYMKNDRKYYKNTHLLNYLFKTQTNKKGTISEYVNPAPPRESLKIFGGPLDIIDFRNNSSEYILNNFPMTYLPSQLEKNTKKDTRQKFFAKILPASTKVKKPVNLPDNSLGKILGIITN